MVHPVNSFMKLFTITEMFKKNLNFSLLSAFSCVLKRKYINNEVESLVEQILMI
jgi:hypothetical protein